MKCEICNIKTAKVYAGEIIKEKFITQAVCEDCLDKLYKCKKYLITYS